MLLSVLAVSAVLVIALTRGGSSTVRRTRPCNFVSPAAHIRLLALCAFNSLQVMRHYERTCPYPAEPLALKATLVLQKTTSLAADPEYPPPAYPAPAVEVPAALSPEAPPAASLEEASGEEAPAAAVKEESGGSYSGQGYGNVGPAGTITTGCKGGSCAESGPTVSLHSARIPLSSARV